MALVSCNQESKRSATASIGQQNEYVHSYVVKTSTSADDEYTVGAAFESYTGITKGTLHPTDSNSYCKGLTVQSIDVSGKVWRVSVTYGKDINEGVQNPLLQPVVYEWSFGNPTVIYTNYDQYGNAIVNTAGELIYGGMPKMVSSATLKATGNFASGSISTAVCAAYSQSVNSDTFLGAPPRCVKCENINVRTVYDQDWGTYLNATVVFVFNLLGWDQVIISQGLRELSGGALKDIKKDGKAVTEPWPLSLSGAALSDAAVTAGNFVWGKYEVQHELPFSIFGF